MRSFKARRECLGLTILVAGTSIHLMTLLVMIQRRTPFPLLNLSRESSGIMRNLSTHQP